MKYRIADIKAGALLLAAVAGFSGCSGIHFESVHHPEVITFIEVSTPDSTITKTSLGSLSEGKRHVYWSDGDKLSADGLASNALTGLAPQTRSAVFSFGGSLTAPYDLLYPASFWTDAGTITLPSTQNYSSGSFATNTLPMACRVTSGEEIPSMSHLCAILKLSLLKDAGVSASSISKITFTGGDGEQVCGLFDIDYSTPSISGAAASPAGRTLTLNVGEPLSESDALELFLVVPAQTYTKGFSVTIEDEFSRTMTKRRTPSTTLTAGRLIPMASFTFVPSALASEFTIEDITEDVLVPDDYTVTGRVVDGSGNGLDGVVVTDGTLFTRTLTDGSFYLETDPSTTKFIYVSTPSGYMPAVSGGIPRFYKLLSDITPEGGIYDCGDFTLSAVSNPDTYTLFITADPQPRSRGAGYDNYGYHSLDCCNDLYRELTETAAGVAGRQVYGICLGDIVHDNMSLFSDYSTGLSGLGYPTYNVIGNHDYNTSAADDDAAAAEYESYFGPRNYSFNIGGIHYVVLDNLMMYDEDSDGLIDEYEQGLTDEIWYWLQKDLSYIPKSSTLMICAHSPMFRLHTGRERSAAHKDDYAALFAKFAKVHAWAGHEHATVNHIYTSGAYKGLEAHTLARSTGELWTNEYLSNGTPRGFTIVEVEDGAITSWRFHPTKYQSGSLGSYADATSFSPDYTHRDWTYNASGVAKMKDGGATLDEDYQMHLYEPGTYESDYLYANIFLWDTAWKMPVFTPDGGDPVTMTRYTAADRYDYANNEFKLSYYNNYTDYPMVSSGSYSSAKTGYPNTMFRVAASAYSGGTVTVTDRWGVEYSSHISW